MRKGFWLYIVVWIGLIGLFNLCCFIIPIVDLRIINPEGFWIEYGFVMLAFLLHLLLGINVFSNRNSEKQVINTSLTTISFFEIILMIIVGSVCMMNSAIPYWLGIIICYFVLCISVVLLFVSKMVDENTLSANQVLNSKTIDFRRTMDRAKELNVFAKGTEFERITNKVYEVIRYSDPVSHVETKSVEMEIDQILDNMGSEIKNGSSVEVLEALSDKVLISVERRNNMCKELKRNIVNY